MLIQQYPDLIAPTGQQPQQQLDKPGISQVTCCMFSEAPCRSWCRLLILLSLLQVAERAGGRWRRRPFGQGGWKGCLLLVLFLAGF